MRNESVPEPEPLGPSLSTPSPLAVLRELKVLFEIFELYALKRFIRSKSPRGDGHTVIVLPGFGHSNTATNTLRRFLCDLDYNALPWAIDRNTGLSPDNLSIVIEQVQHEYIKSGRPVSLIGWSLGGIYSRIVANTSPDYIRQVITLASPFKATDIEQPGRFAQALLGPLEPLKFSDLSSFVDLFQVTPPVPSTSIFSRGDHVVSTDCCIDEPGPEIENIRTWGSHTGMVLNPFVYAIVANRLSLAPGEWRPFEPDGIYRKFAFPVTK